MLSPWKGGGRYDARCPRGLAWKRRIRGRHHKEGHAGAVLPPQFRVHEAGHPIPDERGVKATSLAISALTGSTRPFLCWPWFPEADPPCWRRLELE